MIKRLFKFLLFILCLGLALSVLMAGLLATERGSRWFVHWMIDYHDIPLTIEQVSGSILNESTYAGVDYRDKTGLQISAERIGLTWTPRDLLRLRLTIDRIETDGLAVRPATGDDSGPGIPWLALPDLPVPIDIRQMRFLNSQLLDAEQGLAIERVVGNARMHADGLSLHIASVEAYAQQFSGDLKVTAGPAPEFHMNAEWRGTAAGEPGQGLLRLQGPQQDLAVKLDIDSIIRLRSHGRLDLTAFPVQLAFEGEADGELPAAAREYLQLADALRFRIEGNSEFFESGFNTRLQTADGVGLDFAVNADVALPGPSSEGINTTFEWQLEPESGAAFPAISGHGDVEYLDDVLSFDHATALPYATTLAGKLRTGDEVTLDARLDWEALRFGIQQGTDLLSPSGNIRATGRLETLAVSAAARVTTLPSDHDGALPESHPYYRGGMEGEVNATGGRPLAELAGTLEGPVPVWLQDTLREVQTIDFNLDLGEQAARFNLTGAARTVAGNAYALVFDSSAILPTADRDALSADFNWSVRPTDNSDRNGADGRGTLSYQQDHLQLQHHLHAPFPSELDATLDLAEGTAGSLVLDLDWQDLELSLDDTEPWRSAHGQVHAEGPLDALTLDLQARIDSGPLGPARVKAAARWTDPLLALDRIAIELLDGELLASGQINIDAIPRGQLEARATKINLGVINPDFDSRIEATARVDFSYEDDSVYGELQVPALTGQWRGHTLQGKALASRNAERLRIEALHLVSGENRIDMQLSVDQSLSGAMDVSLTDLSVFSSELAGVMQGRVNIGGTPANPQLQGDFSASDIYAYGLRMASLTSGSNIDLGKQRHSTLSLKATTLQYDELLLDSLAIEGQGLTEAHSVDIEATGKDLQLAARLSGNYDARNWLGSLEALDLAAKHIGAWQLARPARIDWTGASSKISLQQACLQQDDASICVAASSVALEQLDVGLALNRVPMAVANPWLPQTMNLTGTISGDVSIEEARAGWQTQAQLEGADTRIRAGYDDKAETLDVPQVSIKASTNAAKSEWHVQLASPGYFELLLNGQIEHTGQRLLSATALLGLQQLEWLAHVEPALTGSSGEFKADLALSGSLDTPTVKGQFALSRGQLSVLPIGLVLDRIDGEFLSGDGYRELLFTSVLGREGKSLSLAGDIVLESGQGFPYRMQITGDDFPLVRTADITLDISPTLKLHGSTKLHTLRGDLAIPLLQMLVSSLPEDSVTISPDTVIIQSRQPGAVTIANGDPGSDFIRRQLDIDVRISIGPEILIQGFGLTTGVVGDIKVVKPVDVYQPRGEGLLNLTQGSYRAYGQNLVIDQGQLQFAGPIDNPGINIRAYRPNLKVRPGVNVTGSVRQPKLSLYSEPAQSDADTLAYLVTGRPMTGVSSGEASLLSQAALSLAAEESSILANEIESAFSLDEFAVGAGDTLDSASVSAGKKLTPNLSVRSSFNPFNQLWSFLMNYRLTDHWSVQTESGATQGADIIYSIETSSFADLFRKIWSF